MEVAHYPQPEGSTPVAGTRIAGSGLPSARSWPAPAGWLREYRTQPLGWRTTLRRAHRTQRALQRGADAGDQPGRNALPLWRQFARRRLRLQRPDRLRVPGRRRPAAAAQHARTDRTGCPGNQARPACNRATWCSSTRAAGSVSHIGIYVGEGRFVHAPSSGGTVRLDRLDTAYWSDSYKGAKRVLR